MNPNQERQLVPLQHAAEGRFFGMRHAAVRERERIEGFLAQGAEVVIDFAGAAVTQSFVDELVGRLMDTDNLVLGHLHAIRATLDDHRRRLAGIQTELASLGQQVGGLTTAVYSGRLGVERPKPRH
jgi:hypothetical protein